MIHARHLVVVIFLGCLLNADLARAECPDALAVKPGTSKLVGSLLDGACDAVKGLAGDLALTLLKSVATSIGILSPSEAPPLVDLSEASLQKIEDLVQRQVSTHLRQYAFSEFQGDAASIEYSTIHYDAITNEPVKLDYLMTRFLPDVFDITNDGIFYNDDLTNDTFALAVPFSGVANAFLVLVNHAHLKGQYDVATAFSIVRDVRNRLYALQQLLRHHLRLQTTWDQSSSCSTHSAWCRIRVSTPVGNKTFSSSDFPPGVPSIAVEAAAGRYLSERLEHMYRLVDTEDMIQNTLLLFKAYRDNWGIDEPW